MKIHIYIFLVGDAMKGNFKLSRENIHFSVEQAQSQSSKVAVPKSHGQIGGWHSDSPNSQSTIFLLQHISCPG